MILHTTQLQHVFNKNVDFQMNQTKITKMTDNFLKKYVGKVQYCTVIDVKYPLAQLLDSSTAQFNNIS